MSHNTYFLNDQIELDQPYIDDEEEEDQYDTNQSTTEAQYLSESVHASSSSTTALPFKTKHQPCNDFFFLFLFLCFLLILSVVYGSSRWKWKAQPKTLLYPTDFLGRSCGSQNKAPAASTSTSGGNSWFRRKSDQKNVASLFPSVNTLSVPYVAACQSSVYSEECQQQVWHLFKDFYNSKEDQFYDLTSKPYLYFLDTQDPTAHGGICVSYCPGMKKNANYCPPELEPNMKNGTAVGGCMFKRPDGKEFVEPSDQLQFRTVINRCIPTSQSLKAAHFVPATDVLSKYASMLPPAVTESVAHVARQWKIILLSMVGSLLLGFVFMFVIRLFAKFFIWFAISTVFIMLLAASSLSLMEAFQWREKYIPISAVPRSENFYYYSSMLSTQMYGLISIALGMLLIVYSWFLYLHMKTVNRAVGIMREAARAVSSVPQLMLFSVGMFSFLLVFYLYWFLMSINLWSSGSTVVEKQNTVFAYSKLIRLSSTLHLFAFFWISQFITAFTTTAAANVISQWYFTPKQKRGTMFLTMPVARAASTVLFYSLGSVAFGSLVVGTVKFLSFVLKRFVAKVERALKNKPVVGTLASILAWIIRFFISIFNWIVSTITKHAYIQVAIYGTTFLASSRKAMKLIRKHNAQILVLDWIVDWVLFCGKIFVAIATCYLAYWMSLVIPSSSGKVEPTNNFSLLLLSFIFFTSYRISSLFFNVYETATDTIIQCYMIDEQLCVSEPSRMMCCSTELLGLMEFEKQMNEAEIRTNGE